jgi:glucokinase
MDAAQAAEGDIATSLSTSQEVLGIEIGGTKLQLVAGSSKGSIHTRWRATIVKASGAQGIRDQLAAWLPQVLTERQPSAIGVGFGGPVLREAGTLARSHQIEGWSGFPLVGWLQERSGLPVALENDANVAALGEARCGSGRGVPSFFYVTLGSGVGGGYVVNGQLHHGAPPGEAEIGHIRLDRLGTRLEDQCSGWALDRRVLVEATRHPNSPLARWVSRTDRAQAACLGSALAEGDPNARALLDAWADDLAFGLSHVVHLLHPHRLILGGGLAHLGSPALDAVQRSLPGYLMEVFRPGPEIVLAGLGEDTVPVGALLLAADLLR